MLFVIGALLAAVVIIWIDLPTLLQRKDYREIGVFAGLLILGVAINLARGAKIGIPNPLDWMAAFYKPFSTFLFGLFN